MHASIECRVYDVSMVCVLSIQSIYESIKKEPFKFPEDDGNDLMHTFFNPDKEGWLWKQGTYAVVMHASNVIAMAYVLIGMCQFCAYTSEGKHSVGVRFRSHLTRPSLAWAQTLVT